MEKSAQNLLLFQYFGNLFCRHFESMASGVLISEQSLQNFRFGNYFRMLARANKTPTLPANLKVTQYKSKTKQ